LQGLVGGWTIDARPPLIGTSYARANTQDVIISGGEELRVLNSLQALVKGRRAGEGPLRVNDNAGEYGRGGNGGAGVRRIRRAG